MKNIHVLPTEKPSRLIIYSTLLNEFRLLDEPIEDWKHKRNIYITSDEEIKEDYVIAYGVVIKVMMFDKETLYFVNGTKAKREDCKKIILTTDQDLIKDGVQAINDNFLEWFVKNPSCEWVDIETMMECEKCGKEHCDNLQCRGYKDIPYYKIIIPKEEPKQDLEKEMFELEQELDIPSHLRWHSSKPKQETTLEKAAERFYPPKTTDLICSPKLVRDAFKAGAKWQQEQYNKQFKNK